MTRCCLSNTSKESIVQTSREGKKGTVINKKASSKGAKERKVRHETAIKTHSKKVIRVVEGSMAESKHMCKSEASIL